jgi:hypothetical protein
MVQRKKRMDSNETKDNRCEENTTMCGRPRLDIDERSKKFGGTKNKRQYQVLRGIYVSTMFASKTHGITRNDHPGGPSVVKSRSKKNILAVATILYRCICHGIA